jgi:outer membrane protein assembly factor BamB
MRPRYAWAVLLIGLAAPRAPAGEANWPQFLGPAMNGHAPADAVPPTKWSETDRVKWKTPIPGEGFSSPVVWGGQVWLTTSVDHGRSLHAVCADLGTGKVVHDVEVFAVANPGAKHDFNSFASPTPVVEAGRVYVYFGPPGLACLDSASGKTLWTNTAFNLSYLTGAGSSPVLYDNLLILDCDGVDDQFIAGIDKATGKVVWKTTRSKAYNRLYPHKKRAFSTSVVTQIGGRDRLLSVAAGRTYCYDPRTGRELWNVDHGGYSNVARPLLADGMLVFSSGYDVAQLTAVRLPEAEPAGGEPPTHLPDSAVAWRAKLGIYKPSLLLVDDLLYAACDNGVAKCLDTKTGRTVWSKRLGQAYSASPLFAGGRLYFFSEKGEVHVLKPGGAEAEVVAEFQMDEGFMATPAVVGNALIVRTKGHLYRVE